MNPFLEHAHTLLVFADVHGWPHAVDFASEASRLGVEVELHILGEDVDGCMTDESLQKPVAVWTLEEASDAVLTDYLQDKKMGARLYVCASDKKIGHLQAVFEMAGFAREEVYFETIAIASHPVFCVGCYGVNESNGKEIICCEHCHRTLAVSSHYSSRLRAVLGYIIIPAQNTLE